MAAKRASRRGVVGRHPGAEPGAEHASSGQLGWEEGYEPMAATADLERGWEACDPHRDRTLCPYTDADTARIVDEGVVSLVCFRAPMWPGDPGPTISVLVSLAAEAEGRLYEAVADAADQGYSWEQVASRVATSVATARRRYAGYARSRRKTLLDGT